MTTQTKKTVKQFAFLANMPKKKKPAPFIFKPFSLKQKKVLTWWREGSPVKDKDGIVCDGSVRAGKTVVMSLSYVMWAMESFTDENFGMAGKTIGSLRRNVITPLKRMLKSRGYKVKDHRADNFLTISFKGKTNYFYIFGGKDESSQDLIQGITLAGMFFDEVALMPQSFVNQATARCSVEGAKFWFNCNPEGPYHWFKLEYLDKMKEKKLVHIHFTMDDNLSLSERVKERYRRLYTGVFFQRYILGLWVLAEGIIYDMFRDDPHVIHKVPDCDYFFLACDYGTQNPCVFLLLGRKEETIYIVKEYYYDGRNKGIQRTDSQYADDLEEFLKGIEAKHMYVDPSASSFIAELQRRNIIKVRKADNDVLNGIRSVSKRLSNNQLFVHESCMNTKKEFASYVWDEKAAKRGEDKPLKENDHAMDALRYGVYNELELKKDVVVTQPLVTTYEDLADGSYFDQL